MLGVNNRERKSWVVWQEGMRFPDVIIELLSDSTRAVDLGEKKDLCQRVFHTSEYYLYDPFSQKFIAYHLNGSGYKERAPDEQGRVYSPATGLSLAVRDEWLRWITPDGEVIPSPQELADKEQRRADEEQHRAEEEQRRADEEHQRAEQAEQLLKAYRRRFGSIE